MSFGGSPVLNGVVVSEGSVYDSPVHWPQPINSKSLHRSTGAGKGAVTCPRPSYYFNTLCLPLRSFYLSDFSRTHHLGPSRGQTRVSRQEKQSNDLLETSAIGFYRKREQERTARRRAWVYVGTVSDEPDCDGSCLWSGAANLTPEQLLGGFSSSSWWAFAALWWPHGPESGEGVERLGDPGVGGVIYFTTMSLFMSHTAHNGFNLTVLRRRIRASFPNVITLHHFVEFTVNVPLKMWMAKW